MPTFNKRIHYAIRQAGFAKDGTSTFLEAHGVQSIGITTNFNLEQVFEIGQISIYENIEQIPEIEVTMEKVLDGYPLLYHLATNGATSGSITGRSRVKTIFAMSVFKDTQDSASGTPLTEVHLSGLTVSAVTLTFPVDGNCTEAVTFVGNNKVWKDLEDGDTGLFSGRFNNADQPLAINGSGGVQRREDLLMEPVSGSPTGLDENGQSNGWCCVWPTDIHGIPANGLNPVVPADGTYLVPLQTVSVTTDLGREEIFELGRKTPYDRFVTFPVEVRTEIEAIATRMDGISATEVGGENGAPLGSNIKHQTIRIRLRDGTQVDTGKKNKLTTVGWTGGDAGGGGGNVTNRYTYISHNDLWVYHPQDPSAIAIGM